MLCEGLLFFHGIALFRLGSFGFNVDYLMLRGWGRIFLSVGLDVNKGMLRGYLGRCGMI